MASATLAMVGLSWPLWVDGGGFPRVPLFRGWPALGDWPASGLAVLMAGSMALAMVGPIGRGAMATGLVLLGIAFAGDQNRLQPWAIQYAVVGLATVAMPKATSDAARAYAIALYLASGLSKLDVSFVEEMGSTFLTTALGRSSLDWPVPVRLALILAMPAWEIAVAVGLGSGRWRRWALAGAIAQHSALLAILGPWGLGHSPNVLIWNAAMIAEDWLIFRFKGPSKATRVGLGIGLALAFAERSGVCDSWPAHALYASHAERSEVAIHEDDSDRWPEAIRRRLGPPGFDGYRALDATAWSRDLRGVPIYPQARVGLGIAEALAQSSASTHPIRATAWTRAGPISGRRERSESLGLAAIRRRGDDCWINAHPAVVPSRNSPGRPVR